MTMAETTEPERGFTLVRTLDAPPEQVYQAWTDPDHLQWFFNPAAPIPSEPIELDLRVGGAWRQRMVINDDLEYVTGGVYLEIVPGEKLVFMFGASDGWPKIDADRPEDSPVVTILLNAVGDKTEMILQLSLPAHLSDEQVREWLATGMREGWGDTIDRLVAAFAGAAVRS
jgi:uncharacterized protein YndB with AHSA1/START domain